MEQIETQTGIRNMAVTMPLDLSSFKSIQAFALDFKNRGIGLDVLVNSTLQHRFQIANLFVVM